MIDSNTIFTMSNLSLNGRMGNQLFQISALVGLAEKYNCKYVLPNWHYAQYFKGQFNQMLEVSSIITHKYHEPHFHYSELIEEDIIEVKPGASQTVIDLSGYFQSEKYWIHCKDKILQVFEFKDDVINNCENYLLNSNLSLKRLTSIHLRFGDYVNNSYYADLINSNYYVSAIARSQIKTDHYLIFSDDIELAIKNFKDTLTNFDYIEGVHYTFVSGFSEIEDLYLQSQCFNNIIANSSYSFWGAYLNENKNKTVFAPNENHWFGKNLAISSKDIYTSNMILL